MGVKERREHEKEVRREQILDAARKLLFSKGLKATSVNKIAKEAELSIGTIYFYYKNKEEIFAVLQEEGLNLLFKEIEKIYRKKTDPRNKLKNMGLAYLNFSEKEKDYFEIINYFISSTEILFPPNIKNQIDESGGKILSLVTLTIDEGINKGLFVSGDSNKFAIMFWAMNHGLIQLKKLKNTIMHGRDYKNLYLSSIDCLLDGFAHK